MWLLKEEYREQYGIYYIYNTLENKMYIGKCSNTKGLQTRIRHHYNALKRKKHDNPYLQNAFNKSGEDAFKVGVLQLCNREDTLTFEQEWLSKALLFKSKYYNASFISEGHIYIREETRKKLSEVNLGKVYSEEYKANISKSQRGKFRKDNPTGFTGVSQMIRCKNYYFQIRRYGIIWAVYGYKTPEEASEDYQYGLTLSDEELTEWVEFKRKLLRSKQSSKHTGVSFDKTRNKWNAYVDKNGKRKSLSYYETEEEAYQARKLYIETNLI